MLQQWRKPTTITLTPNSIAIKSTAKVTRVIELPNKSSWSQDLIELEKNGHDIKAPKVRFVISNNYVRYAVLPWQNKVYSQQDWQSLAENHLRSLYGNELDAWKVNVAMQGYGQPLIISAIDLGLLNQLQEIAAQFNWTIETVEPALMTVFNHYQSKFKSNDYLMIMESQRVLLAEMNEKGIVSFALAAPVEGQERVESSSLIARALQLNNKASTTLHLISTDGMPTNIDLDNIIVNPLSVEQSAMSLMLAELI